MYLQAGSHNVAWVASCLGHSCFCLFSRVVAAPKIWWLNAQALLITAVSRSTCKEGNTCRLIETVLRWSIASYPGWVRG